MQAIRYRKCPRVVERAIRGERVLVPLARSTETLDSLYTLNTTAGLVWDLAGSGKTEVEIAETVVEQYEVDKDTALADVRSVTTDLVMAGVLERCDAE